MNFFQKFTRYRPHFRHFCSVLYQEELTVQTFCDIHVNVPYNVKLKPLDVHKYHNCDLLKIELMGAPSENCHLKHLQDGNNIRIFTNDEKFSSDVICKIHAPVKANLHVDALGNISSGVFSGSKLVLHSKNGAIFVDKFQGEHIQLMTVNGDIILKGAVIAANIDLNVTKSGSIKTNRLQGLSAVLKTNAGDINVDSSYCDIAIFETQNGNVNLQNVHKNSTILLNNGNLNLTGLDGTLVANLTNTNAEIQLSQILENSSIKIDGGDLKLYISEDCQDKTHFEINASNFEVDSSIKLIPSKSENTLYLTAMNEHCKLVTVDCGKGSVFVQGASWINMLKLKMEK